MASARAWSVQAHVPSAGSSLRTRNRRARPPRASSVDPEASAGGSVARDSGDGAGSPNTRTPHSGYHRIEGFPRPFFEGWYFRVTLPEIRDNLSLIYHVYDPDLRRSERRGAGAQVCTPGGKYIWRESHDVERFTAAPHELALRMDYAHAEGGPEFYEVACGGRVHRGRLRLGDEVNDPSVWPPEKLASEVRWDFTVEPVAGYGDRGRATSTAGWLSSLPVFEPHYQITMAHGLATGWIETNGARVEFAKAPAYSEKNWGGAGFPSRWFWLQCNSFRARPGLSVTATGGNRGVVILPGVREEVAAITIHAPGGGFFPFVPVAGEGFEAADLTWSVSPWGRWTVRGVTPTHEVEIAGWIAPTDDVVGGTTVLRAPMDDAGAGMAPLCRESFRGSMRVSLWERDAAATWNGGDDEGGSRSGDGGGSGSWGDGGAGKGRGRCILDGVQSDTAAVEVGGGPWTEAWVGSAEMREPLGTLAGAPVDVDAVAGFFKRVGLDVVPGL